MANYQQLRDAVTEYGETTCVAHQLRAVPAVLSAARELLASEEPHINLLDTLQARADWLRPRSNWTVPLPPEQVRTLDGRPTRVRFGYGFIEYAWGPKYLNAHEPALDVPPLKINGKLYRSVRVSVDDAGEVAIGYITELTDAARRKLPDIAHRSNADLCREFPLIINRWLRATAQHREAWAHSKALRAVEQCIETLQALESETS